MHSCASCSELMMNNTCLCPHCGSKRVCASKGRSSLPTAALILGLTAACSLTPNNNTDDTWEPQPAYGVPETGWVDEDGDGVTIRDGDCDDGDATIFPGAAETVGDGIDSNCDGNDDT